MSNYPGGRQVGVRLSDAVIARVHSYRAKVEKRSGMRLSEAAVIRSLVQYGLDHHKIPNKRGPHKGSKKR